MRMIERVGRALAKEEGYAYDPYPYDVRARAVIEAIREMGEPCGVCGCPVYPLPKTLDPK